MLGVYDFCGHYEWTFEWFRQEGGHELVREYWDTLGRTAQTHTLELIKTKGVEGMKEYWGHTLEEEAAGYHASSTENSYRIDMHQCPSKGFLIKNDLEQYSDYCDHCMGWIGPLMKRAGYTIDHQHNHMGQCWWEIRKASDATPSSGPGELSGNSDIRLSPEWRPGEQQMDTYSRSNDPDDKHQN